MPPVLAAGAGVGAAAAGLASAGFDSAGLEAGAAWVGAAAAAGAAGAAVAAPEMSFGTTAVDTDWAGGCWPDEAGALGACGAHAASRPAALAPSATLVTPRRKWRRVSRVERSVRAMLPSWFARRAVGGGAQQSRP